MSAAQAVSNALPHNVPEEVLVDILRLVDSKTLMRCRSVSKLWKHLIDNEVWREKARTGHYRSLRNIDPKRKLPNYLYYWICTKDPFEKNLLKNNCGQEILQHWTVSRRHRWIVEDPPVGSDQLPKEKLHHWTVLSSGGDSWKVEDTPAGSDPLPQDEEFGNHTCCFATSFHSCTKKQEVDLWKEALPGKVLDDLQPVIEISDWYAARFDCGCFYDIQATLLKANKKRMNFFQHRETVEQWQGREWHKVSHRFENYGPGLRYVVFYHGGMDTQFWAGHYGSKMSGACVKLLIPSQNVIHQNNDNEIE